MDSKKRKSNLMDSFLIKKKKSTSDSVETVELNMYVETLETTANKPQV